jgi:hypothetical protein
VSLLEELADESGTERGKRKEESCAAARTNESVPKATDSSPSRDHGTGSCASTGTRSCSSTCTSTGTSTSAASAPSFKLKHTQICKLRNHYFSLHRIFLIDEVFDQYLVLSGGRLPSIVVVEVSGFY